MNLKLTMLAVTGLVLIPGSVANAAEGYSSVKVLLGSKSLDSDWGNDDSMETIGFQATYQPKSLPFGIAFDFYGSGNEDEIGSNKTETTVAEINLGLRYSPTIIAGAFSPYLGGGISYAAVELTQVGSGVETKYDDTGIGYWVGGGIDYLFSDYWFIGINAQYSTADVELNNGKLDAGGFSWGATFGYRF